MGASSENVFAVYNNVYDQVLPAISPDLSTSSEIEPAPLGTGEGPDLLFDPLHIAG